MGITLFNSEVDTREYGCSFWGAEPKHIDTPYINLSIQLNTACNGKCKFCEYHTDCKNSFNFDKLREIASEIYNKTRLFKLNFTGGEPTLDIDRFDKALHICDTELHGNLGEFTVNTNGIHLDKLLPYMDKISYVALSRHHWDDKINNEIFGTNSVAQALDIEEFLTKCKTSTFKLHLRCNLIKGYVDTTDKIAKYLSEMTKIGVQWFGLVTLLDLNDWCLNHTVVADKLLDDPRFSMNQLWERYENNKLECRCGDYLYTQDGRLAIFYHRIFSNSSLNAGQLVFDGTYLRQGFGGKIIY